MAYLLKQTTLILSLFFFTLYHCTDVYAYENQGKHYEETESADETKKKNKKVEIDDDIGISVAMLVQTIVGILVTFIVGFIGFMMIKSCKWYRVVSAVLFVTASVVYLVEEIALYIVYLVLGAMIKDVYKKQKVKNEHYNEQIKAVKKMRDLLYVVFGIELAKGLLISAYLDAILAAEAMALIEMVLLFLSEDLQKASQKATSVSCAALDLTEPDIAASEEYIGAMQTPITSQVACCNQAGDVIIPTAQLGKPKEESEETADEQADIIYEGSACMTEGQANVTAAVAESEVQIAAGDTVVSVIGVATVGIGTAASNEEVIRAELALATTEILHGEASSSVSSYSSTTKSLMSARYLSLLNCPSLSSTDSSDTTSSIINFFTPNAYADSTLAQVSNVFGMLKLMGVTGPILGLTKGLKKVKTLLADKMLYHPMTRAVFFNIIAGFVTVAMTSTFVAAGLTLERALKMQKLADRLAELESNNKKEGQTDIGADLDLLTDLTVAPGPTNPNLTTTSVEDMQKFFVNETLKQDKKKGILDGKGCVSSDLTPDTNCSCKKNNSCQGTPKFETNSFDLVGEKSDLDTAPFKELTGELGSLASSYATGNIKEGNAIARSIIEKRAYFQKVKETAIEKLEALPNGINYSELISENKKAIKNDLFSLGNHFTKENTSEAKKFMARNQSNAIQTIKQQFLDSTKNSSKSLPKEITEAINKEMDMSQVDIPIVNLEIADLTDDLEKNGLKKEKSEKIKLDVTQGKLIERKMMESFQSSVNVSEHESIFSVISSRYQKSKHRLIRYDLPQTQ